MTFLYLMIWWTVGMASASFWSTVDHDLKVKDLHLVVLLGVLGPVAFLIGAAIHLSHNKKLVETVLIRKRGRKQ